MTIYSTETPELTIQGKPTPFVVQMSICTPVRGEAAIRRQFDELFPDVPVIFVDQGTSIGVIHATE